MKSNQLQKLWAYNEWANRRILVAAAQLSHTQFTEPAASSFGSLRTTLVHIYGAEWVWRQRCLEHVSPSNLPDENDFPDLESLRSAWETEMQRMTAFLDQIMQLDPESPIVYQNTKGLQMSSPFWQILYHLVNHGTQFRSEAGMLLTAWGYSPGDMDMILFFRQNLI
jgi:uncharacterized damage-inducible protein DinB